MAEQVAAETRRRIIRNMSGHQCGPADDAPGRRRRAEAARKPVADATEPTTMQDSLKPRAATKKTMANPREFEAALLL
ncbi:MAG: hypothetical protein ACXW3M_07625, partial [Rhodoplanes sp.]